MISCIRETVTQLSYKSSFLLFMQVEMENMATKEKYVFSCNRWMAKNEDDGAIVREIPAEGPGIKTPLPCK